MSHFKSVKLALDTKLNEFPGLNVIAWENIKFDPTLDTLYLRPTLIPATSTTATMEGIQSNSGIYQIDVISGLNVSVSEVLDKMDALYDHFKGVSSLTKDGVELFLGAISRVRLVTDQSRLIGTIQVNYNCYNN